MRVSRFMGPLRRPFGGDFRVPSSPYTLLAATAGGMAMAHDCFAPGVKLQPYWWDEAPRPELPEIKLPSRIDVAIIGAGYTGLAAGMALARAGRSVLALDAEAAGWGASSRNQGHIGIMKRPFAEMERALGHKLAVALMREGQDAVDYTKDFI